jgi:hypothetical protein
MSHLRVSPLGLFAILPVLALAVATAGTVTRGQAVEKRVQGDLALGHPIVLHVVVALCDNVNQGIVPVQKTLGNGQDAKSNLYWGAAFGVRTFLTKRAGWLVVSETSGKPPVRERLVLRKTLPRGDGTVPAYVIAEAWDGLFIRDAITRFLTLAAGHGQEVVSVPDRKEPVAAGGASHLVVFVGHDGLMDFSLTEVPKANPAALPRSSVVLACASKAYFSEYLSRGGSHTLLLTTGLMAPEAYTLDAVVAGFAKGLPPSSIREAAALAYSRYQHCSLKAARGLFWSEE